jgi:large subunit ribosomal protein L25
MRRAGRLPGIIYGGAATHHVEIEQHAFEQMLHHHASENLILDVEIDGEPLGKALLKEVQHDPLSGHPLHVDLVEVSMTDTLRVSIPIDLVGHPVGVEFGGNLEHALRELEVECLPDDIVDSFQVDVSALRIGDTILVRELQLGDKYTILAPGDLAVAAVAEPRIEEEPVAAEGAAEAPAEPEVIGRKAAEEEEEEEAAKPEKGGGKRGE